MEEFKIVNKIIPISNILDIAAFLENKSEEYSKLFESDKIANQDLTYLQKKINMRM